MKPCITCESATKCITVDCEESFSGLFKQGIECKKCEYPCKTCLNTAKNCLSKIIYNIRIIPMVGRTYRCTPMWGWTSSMDHLSDFIYHLCSRL